MTKKIILSLLVALFCIGAFAQNDSKSFCAYLYNNEYNVYLRINFYDQDVEVPGQELYGQLPGFLGKKHNSFCWVITSCEVKSEREAVMQLINDYGSDDLTAKLVRKNDSIYLLKQITGNTIKVPNNGKWLKLPKVLEMKRK